MTSVCFTSFNFAYAEKASILAKTLKKSTPGWKIVAVVTDKPGAAGEKLVRKYFDDVIYTQDLGVLNYDLLLRRYSIVEMCTAVKGDALCYLLEQGYDNVVYLDPDIAVYDSLTFMDSLLQDYNVLLTPHVITPEINGDEMAIAETEVSALKFGIYNLGFIAVKNSIDGKRCATWWRDRLRFKCVDSPGEGYFTDQKWCNHIPIFFDGVYIIKDFGCNVASWNLNERKLRITEAGAVMVNEDTLKFFHFTKFGPVGMKMTKRYARDNYEVFELWSHYSRMLNDMETEGKAAF